MNKKPTVQKSEINDLSRYTRLMRSLPINNEKDEELAKAFEEVDKIESILQNERKVAPSLKFNIE